MPTKAVMSSRLPIRRGLSEAEAAIYVGVSATKFRQMLALGMMPVPRMLCGVRSFDIAELDAAFYNAPYETVTSGPDSWGDFRGGDKAQTR